MDDNSGTYLVGLATTDITPPVGVYLAGFGARLEPSDGVYHPLRATAVAIGDGRQAMLLLVAEWLGFYEHTDPFRERLARRLGVDPSHIVLSGTHTHYGPVLRELDVRRHGTVDQRYLDEAFDRMERCAQQAWSDRRPARLGFTHGSCDIACCRRRPNGNGGVDFAPTLDGLVDHDVTVLTIHSVEGNLRGIVFNYACHPTSNHVRQIGGDYVGFAVEAIEAAHPGVTACFVQGCAADQKVHAVEHATGSFRRLTIEEVRGVGGRMALAVTEAMTGSIQPITGPLRIDQQRFNLMTEPLDRGAVTKWLGQKDFMGDWAAHMQRQLDAGSEINRRVPFEIQTVGFGDQFAIVTMSAEMVVEYGLRLKALLRPHFHGCLIAGYCNDIIGYIPSRRQIPEGGYEVDTSNYYYLRSGRYVEATEETIIAKALKSLGLDRDG